MYLDTISAQTHQSSSKVMVCYYRTALENHVLVPQCLLNVTNMTQRYPKSIRGVGCSMNPDHCPSVKS